MNKVVKRERGREKVTLVGGNKWLEWRFTIISQFRVISENVSVIVEYEINIVYYV